MMSHKYDALHDLLNTVVMRVGAHKPNEYHILNLKTGKARIVKGIPGGQTVLPVLSPEERFDRLVWHMGGSLLERFYEPCEFIQFIADPRIGGIFIESEGYIAPCEVAGVRGQLRRIVRDRDVLRAPSNGRLAWRLCTIVNEAYCHHEDQVRPRVRV